MLGDARHCVRVEHLQEKRANTAHQHGRKVRVHESGDTVDAKVGNIRVDATRGRVLTETDSAADVDVGARANPSRHLSPVDHAHRLSFLSIPAYGFGLSPTTVTCDTGGVTSVKPLRESTTEGDVLTEKTVKTERPWNVVVWDDPVTPMSVVVVIFKRIFGYSNNKCTQLMLTVHHEGRAIVWSGNRDRAESYCVKLQVAGLQSTIEKDE
jgi:ATP-dependent Clp protease adaptor protein ClpS